MRIEREKFLSRLEAAMPGLSQRDIIEQSSCFIFQDKCLVTYNDEVSCRMPISLGMRGAVRASPLVSLLNRLPDKVVDVSQDKKQLLVRGVGKKGPNKRRAGIIMDRDIMLPIDNVEPPKKWKSLPQDFCEAVAIVRDCAGTDATEYLATCIHLTSDFVEASDDTQVARFPLKLKIKESIVVPAEFLKHVAEASVTKFSLGDAWIHFKNPSGLIVSCRMSRQEYPPMDDMLDMKGKKTVFPKGLGEAADRAEIFSSTHPDRNKAIVTMKKQTLVIEGRGSQGWIVEPFRVKYNGPLIRFTITPKLLKDIVERHNDCRITENRIKIDTGAYHYVSCLGSVSKKEK